jgi:hypothetical protein
MREFGKFCYSTLVSLGLCAWKRSTKPNKQKGNEMEILKANIQNVLNTEFESQFKMISAIGNGIELNSSNAECVVATQLMNALFRWADVREYMVRTLNDMVRASDYQRDLLKRGLCVDANEINRITDRYETYARDAKKWEDYTSEYAHIARIEGTQLVDLFIKLNSMIAYK